MNDLSLSRFLAYLDQHCGGEDRTSFTTEDGLPDTGAARLFAEHLREQFGSAVGEAIEIEQRVNVVRVTSLANSAVIAN